MSEDVKYLVSIRLMTFNHENFIIKALESIDKQKTNFLFEVVIGDDFSSDNTLNLIKKFNFSNQNLSVLILNRKIGDSYYIKRKIKGRLYNFFDILSNCRGKYIALLDGDDYWTDENKLQKQVDFLESHSDYTICWTGYKALEEGILLDPVWRDTTKDRSMWDIDFNNFSSPYCTMTLTTMFSKKCIDDLSFKLSNFSFFKDNSLYFQCLSKGKGKFLNFNSAIYRLHQNSVYAMQPEYTKDRKSVV